MHGDASLAQLQLRTIEGVWTFQFVWVLFGASVMNGLIAAITGGNSNGGNSTGGNSNAAVTVVSEYANNATFFMIFLSIKALFSTPFGGLARVPLIVVTSIKKRMGLQAANVVPPEPLAYVNAWPQVRL